MKNVKFSLDEIYGQIVYVTPQTQSMRSTRDNGRAPIKLRLTSVQGLTNNYNNNILNIKSPK